MNLSIGGVDLSIVRPFVFFYFVFGERPKLHVAMDGTSFKRTTPSAEREDPDGEASNQRDYPRAMRPTTGCDRPAG